MNKNPNTELMDAGPGRLEIINSNELAARLGVPPSWVRNRTRGNTPIEERIPCMRLGKYVRFEWLSPELERWLAERRH
jgi:hypothetical protein